MSLGGEGDGFEEFNVLAADSGDFWDVFFGCPYRDRTQHDHDDYRGEQSSDGLAGRRLGGGVCFVVGVGLELIPRGGGFCVGTGDGGCSDYRQNRQRNYGYAKSLFVLKLLHALKIAKTIPIIGNEVLSVKRWFGGVGVLKLCAVLRCGL